jgi:hypothetical protein
VRLTKRLLAGALSAGMVVLLAPEAKASNVAVNFQSSMSATCVGGSYGFADSCEVIRFGLHVPAQQTTTTYIQNQQLHNEVINWHDSDIRGATQLSSDGDLWTFGSALKIWNTNTVFFGGATNLWDVHVSGDELEISETAMGGNWADASLTLYFDLHMSTWQANRADIGVISYGANGQTREVDGQRTATWSAAGTVVPEPTTMILLGSGMLGLVGVVRRRRRNEETGLDTDLEGI